MIGVLVVCHLNMARELVQTAIYLTGRDEQICGIDIDPEGDIDELRDRIGSAISLLDTGEGVLVLTDIFGGTPSNICLDFIQSGRVGMVTGVNLPMLVAVCTGRDNCGDLGELVKKAVQAGKKSIRDAAKIV